MDENRSLTDFATGGGESTADESTADESTADESTVEKSTADESTADESTVEKSTAEDDAGGCEDAGGEAGVSHSETGPSVGEDADAVDPAVSTYRWSSRGAACADCGETVERRWRDGEAYVCSDCKGW